MSTKLETRDASTNVWGGSGPRILFIGHSAGRTGAPIMLLHLLQWLKSNTNLEIMILLRDGGELETQFAKTGKTWLCDGRPVSSSNRFFRKVVRKIFGVSFEPKPKMREKFLQTLKDVRFDLVYSNTITNGEVLEWLTLVDTPVISHVHEMSYWIEASGQINLDLVKKHSLHYVAASNAVKLELHQNWGIPSDKIDVVHSFIPTDTRVPKSRETQTIRQKWSIPSGAFLVVGSGFETWRKGKDLFVDLAVEINLQEPDNNFYFMWVGAWESREHEIEFQLRIEAEDLQDQVLFIGQVDNPLAHFSSADVFAMTSREDPYPLVCLEAALMGLPVLCFESAGGMPEFVEKDAGMIFPYLDVAAMARGILELASSPKEKRKLGDAAQIKVKSRHDVNVGSRQLLQIIMNCIRRD